MRRIFSFLMVCLMCLSIVPVSAEESVAPAAMISVNLKSYYTQNGSGLTGYASCNPPESVSTRLTIYIQRNVNGRWINSCSSTGITTAEVSTIMQSGYSYRVHAVCKVYDANDTLLDTCSTTTAAILYN